MKKKLIIMGIIFVLIVLNVVTSYAAETTVKLVANKTEVKAEETFIVTLKATCDDGINGVNTTYTYDTEKLELVSTKVGTNFSNIGIDNEIALLSTNANKIIEADVFELEFKVKKGVAANSTAQISIAETLLGSDAENDSNHIILAQTITVNIVEEQTPTEPEDPEDPENPKDPTDPETPTTPGGDEEKPTTPPEQQKPTIPEQETVPGTTVVVGGDKNDATVSDKNLPDTGVNVIAIASATLILIVIAIILHKKNKEYKFIK